MQRRVAPLLSLIWVSWLYSQAPPLGVEGLILEAFARNREILAGQQRIAEARGLLRQAGVRPVPTIESSGGSGRPFGIRGEDAYNLEYFHPVETGGKRS